MPHSPIRDRLVAIAAEAADNPSNYLLELSDVHDDWHMEVVRSYGFLLFHHRVVRDFELIVNSRLQAPVSAFSEAQLNDFGISRFGQDPAGVDSIGELAAFSAAVEGWHNQAHRLLTERTGLPLMDARQNIYFRPFWQLHLYIDDLFKETLRRYADATHPGQFLDELAVAGHLEVSHHNWVPRI